MGEASGTPVVMDYWKNYITIHHVMACELSYSLIYDNIRPDKLTDALATVGLTRLPNRFFLIQVDDYYNYSSKMRITQEFFQKTALIKILRESMESMGLTGFMANLVGQDDLICFLCCPEQEGPGIRDYLLNIADAFKAVIRERSAYTISICVSQRCDRLNQFSQMFPRMNLALSKSYFFGKEFSILLEDMAPEAEEDRTEISLNDFYPKLLAAFARRDRLLLEEVLETIMRAMLEGQIRPQRAKMELARMMQRIGEYCVQCGVPEDWVRRRGDQAMTRLLDCRFVSDTRACLYDFYGEISRALEKHSADSRYSFKIPVVEYIAAHYMESIRVADLADMMGFSEGHFARTFRREFGQTFIPYLTEYRIQRSKELLSDTRIPVDQIASQVGLSSYSYFCTCFKRLCGMSPGAYRSAAAQAAGDEVENLK